MKSKLKENRKEAIKDLEARNYSPFTTAITRKIIKDNIRIHNRGKQTIRSMTLAISGQNNLNNAQAHRDPKIDPNCPTCNTKQGSEHVLLKCPDLDHLRQSLDYEDIGENITNRDHKLEVNKLTKIITKSGLFK